MGIEALFQTSASPLLFKPEKIERLSFICTFAILARVIPTFVQNLRKLPMPRIEACLFSPFSPTMVKQDHHRVLLLQFFLKELLAAHEAIIHQAPINLIISSDFRHFPYDWAKESGHLNKAREHAHLLQAAFPQLEEESVEVQLAIDDLVLRFPFKTTLNSRQKQQLRKKLHQLYLLAEPLIRHFKANENLIFFLLKNQSPINALMGEGFLHTFLSQLHKKGLGQLEKKLCDHYHERGFFSLIPELKKLFSGLNPVK